MAVTAQTLTRVAALRAAVGAESDRATRTLTSAWVKSWDDLAGRWQAAAADLAAQQTLLQRWPYPWELSRIATVQQALQATDRQLTVLGQQAGTDVTGASNNAAKATVEQEPGILASQLPAALITAAVILYAGRLTSHAVDAVTFRAGQRIAALTRPLARTTFDAVQREVVRGTPAAGGQSAAARLAGRVESAFNGGLDRALTIARTEPVDASREISAASNKANQDVVVGWIWHSRLALTTCLTCWVMHGTEHPLSEPGPADHVSGRCGRLPKLRNWRDLGISLPEPDGVVMDGKAVFDALPEADQVAILGPARHELLRTGQIRWADLVARRANTGWRDTFGPVPVVDLQRSAAQPI